jgi:spermidine/putrescine transport system ATP-binding protein
MSERATAIRLVDLTRQFERHVAVDRVNLEIYEGEFFSLIGPSGCGKTTTLRIIAGLDHATSGSVLLGERDIGHEPAYKRPVNTVFQQYGLFPHLNVFDNVAFGLKERREPRATIAESVQRMLELVGLGGRGGSRPRQLSGGEQQRVALARALVLGPKVLLLDEPLGALDLKLRRQMQGLLKSLQRELDITFVYVTHDQEEAFSMSDRVGVMNGGKLEQVGAPYDVYQRPQTFFVADFVGAANCLRGVVKGVGARGSYTVQLTADDRVFNATGVPDLALGAPVAALARPEAGKVNASDAGSLCAQGSIADVSYAGPQIAYRVSSNGLGDLSVFCKADASSGLLEVGRSVELSWDTSDLWIFPLDEPSATPSTQPGPEAKGADAP